MSSTEIVKSLQNQHVKEALALQRHKHRVAEQACVVVGEKAIEEARKAGWQAKRFFFRNDVLTPESFSAGKPWQMVSNTILKAIAETESAPPVVAVFDWPSATHFVTLETLACPQAPTETLLVLDGLQDPGNLGTLLRTAVAFGFEHVLIIEPAADAYSSKVIRASTGLQFRLQIQVIQHEATFDVLQALRQKGWHPYLADACDDWHDRALYLHELRGLPEHPMAVVLGQEGQGLRLTQTQKQAFSTLSVAMTDEAESLNVAITGSLILHHLYSLKHPHQHLHAQERPS
jgi:TrmH family RNA methyltransferase